MTNLVNALQNVPMAASINPAKGITLQDLVAQGIPEQFVRDAIREKVPMKDIPAEWSRSKKNPANLPVSAQPKPATSNPPMSAEQMKAEIARLKGENTVMANPSASGISDADMAELLRLRSENAALRAKKALAGNISVKRSEKGAVSVYGLGRFPVTLYAEQWDRLIAQIDKVKTFVNDNRSSLATKNE